jgi:hypothetical protein
VPTAHDLTYATVLDFDRVQREAADLKNMQDRLEGLRNLSAALGLGGTQPGRPPVLVIGPGFTVAEARGRLGDLQRAYPAYADQFRLQGVSETVLGDIRQAAATSYANLIDAGRKAVLARLRQVDADGKETPEDWRQVRDWMVRTDDLQAFRTLAKLLAGLKDVRDLNDPRPADPQAGDPVHELAEFLDRNEFPLDLRRLAVEVPDALKVRPDGPLTISLKSAGGRLRELVFEPVSEAPKRDAQRRVTTYTFRATGDTSLTFRPGDNLEATLPVKGDGGRELQLTWANYRSYLYDFERLHNPPGLRPRGVKVAAGEPARGVSVAVTLGKPIPTVPELMPEVVLK